MKKIHFTKMNGAGNDFVVVDNRGGIWDFDRKTVARICDRHRGVGADGLIAVEPARGGADFRMRYYNSDGGEAEMCGNGARCFARFAASLDGARREAVTFETMAGTISAQIFADGTVELAMGEPHSFAAGARLDFAGTSAEVWSINTGVPHAVVFVGDIGEVPVQEWGAALRWHGHFAPQGTNVNFVAETGPGTLAVRTYERGVEGETLACGTGVVASALLHHAKTGAGSPTAVLVRGGDFLQVRFVAESPGKYSGVFLRGPAEATFRGEIELGLL